MKDRNTLQFMPFGCRRTDRIARGLVVVGLLASIGALSFCGNAHALVKKRLIEREAGDPGFRVGAPSGADSTYGSILFGGYRTIVGEGGVISFGVGLPLGATSFYSFSYTDVGRYGAISSELAYLVSPAAGVHVGILAGPNVDWPNEGVGADPTTYLVGAAGGVAGVTFDNRLGVWGYGKYRFGFAGQARYNDGYVLGAGLYIRY